MSESAQGVIIRDVLTISDAIDLYIGDLVLLNKSSRTCDTYRRCLNDFADTMPARWDVAKVDADDCRRFLGQYSGHSPAYRAQKDSIMRGFFKWLHLNEKIKLHPMERMLPPKRLNSDDVDVVTVSSDDVKALLREAKDWTERLTLGVLAYLGPRRAAISALLLSDYDEVGRRLRFREKGSKTIWKPIPHPLGQLIESAIKAGIYKGQTEPYLIPSYAVQRREGTRDDRIIWKTVCRVADRAGVRAHTHSLRAAFAVYYLESNPGDIEALKELMGHNSILTTQAYLRRLNKATAMERVRDLDWGESPQNAGITFESLPEAEKEGFEPSFDPDSDPDSD